VNHNSNPAASKQTTQKFDMERFNVKNLNEVVGNGEHGLDMANRFAALGSLGDQMDIKRDGETITGNIKISGKQNPGYYVLKQRKSWFDERCSELLYKRKQTKLQWLQNPS
jgi:hypothetical protein